MPSGPESRHTFPLQFALRGMSIELKPLEPSYKEAILQFAREMSDTDLLFLDRDIAQPAVFDQWVEDMKAGRLLTTTAWCSGAIAGYATIFRSNVRWSRHVAELCVVVAESARGKGLGRLLLELMFELALEEGVTKVVGRMTPDQSAVLSLFGRLGFEEEAVLRDHAIDANGCTHDMLLLSYQAGQHAEGRCVQCGALVLDALVLDGARLCSHCFEGRYRELGGGD